MLPELMALKRFSPSCPMGLMPELLELSLAVEEVVELDAEVLRVGKAGTLRGATVSEGASTVRSRGSVRPVPVGHC
jgi:hypothetical protein